MEQNINGFRYEFIVYFEDNYFEISAIRKRDGRKSAITNLNIIISEIIEPILKDNNFEDSFLIVENSKIGRKLFEHSIEILSDKNWTNRYLEKYLDEDFQEEI